MSCKPSSSELLEFSSAYFYRQLHNSLRDLKEMGVSWDIKTVFIEYIRRSESPQEWQMTLTAKTTEFYERRVLLVRVPVETSWRLLDIKWSFETRTKNYGGRQFMKKACICYNFQYLSGRQKSTEFLWMRSENCSLFNQTFYERVKNLQHSAGSNQESRSIFSNEPIKKPIKKIKYPVLQPIQPSR